jgi:TrmH family RNA methyltransferase
LTVSLTEKPTGRTRTVLVYASLMPVVSSRQHPFVQRCRRLAAGRGDAGEILLDGPHLLEDAVAASVEILGVLLDDRGTSVLPLLRGRGIPVHETSRQILEAAAPVRSPSGLVAIARWAPAPATALLALPHPILMGLVGVQDPGNVGNIIRSAEALGASGVVTLDGTADPAGWKALRGAMGATFRLPVGSGTVNDVLAGARVRGIRLAATVPTGGMPPDAESLAAPVLVLIGSEGAGLSRTVVAACDVHLTLPMRSTANSLNAATSAAIVLWELTRPSRTR